MFITGQPGTVNNSGALFVVATARTGSGVASATFKLGGTINGYYLDLLSANNLSDVASV